MFCEYRGDEVYIIDIWRSPTKAPRGLWDKAYKSSQSLPYGQSFYVNKVKAQISRAM